MCIHYLVCSVWVLLFLSAVEGDAEISQLQKRDSRKFCGRQLVDILSLICDGTYNDRLAKKSERLDAEEEYQLIEEPMFPFKSRTAASRLIPGTFRRYTRGVYDECCRKSCTLDEMRSYCGNHASMFSNMGFMT